MSFNNRHGIVPQLVQRGARVLSLLSVLVGTALLQACATVQLQATKPIQPETLQAAEQYLQNQQAEVTALDNEITMLTRQCYQRFFVSDCLAEVKAKRSEYRRAHVLAETAANDLIRINNYNQRQQEKRERQEQQQQNPKSPL